jgi:hypothetical protein
VQLAEVRAAQLACGQELGGGWAELYGVEHLLRLAATLPTLVGLAVAEVGAREYGQICQHD